jgi:hypothetical protein
VILDLEKFFTRHNLLIKSSLADPRYRKSLHTELILLAFLKATAFRDRSPGPGAASASVQGVVHGEYMPKIVPPTEGEGRSAFAVHQPCPPLPRRQDVPPSPPAGTLSPPFLDFLSGSVAHAMQPDVLNTPKFQIEIPVDAHHFPSQTAASGPTSTRQRLKKRKQPSPEGDEHSHTCGWGGTCTANVHPDYLREHLRLHLERVNGDRVRCEYRGCSKNMKKDGLPRHYLTHFGARAECCECQRNFARSDEITRGHKTKENISCPSKRWRRIYI